MTEFRTSDRSIEIPIAELPPVPGWTENYCWDAYDETNQIALWIHNGRWHKDRTLWHEFITMCIGGKTLYSRRNIGRLADPELVGASCLAMRCIQPFESWSWAYHGPALAGPAGIQESTAPFDTTAVLLDFKLAWHAISPMIDFGHGTEPGAQSSHYEQGGRVTGAITVDGQIYHFDGTSFRDHSRGPRDLNGRFNRHSWIHGVFPSGRVLSSLTVETPSGDLMLADLFALQPGAPARAGRFDHTILLDGISDLLKPFRIIGRDAEEKPVDILVEPQFSYGFTNDDPNDLYVGQDPGFPGWRVIEMPSRLTWGDEAAFGNVEFSLPKSTKI